MQSIGPYEVIDVVARGGAGVVYQARDPQAGRHVAIKVLLSGKNAASAQVERFEREALALAKISHENVVRIHSVGVHDGCPYLVMDLVQGESLQELLRRRGQLGLQEAAGIVRKLALALHQAHEAGILHRDVKPPNVLMTPEGEPRLTDFGLARSLDAERGPTKTGALLGTPGFLPPEQAFGKPVGPPADVYGLGATLYSLLTGVPPHTAETMKEFLAALATQDPTAPRVLRPDLDADLQAVCLRCMGKEPEDRYATAAALAEDLTAYLEGKPTAAGTAARTRRRRALAVGAVVGLLGVGLVAAVAAGGEPPTPTEAAAVTTVETVAAAPPAPAEEEEEEEKDGAQELQDISDDWDRGIAPKLPETKPGESLIDVAEKGFKASNAANYWKVSDLIGKAEGTLADREYKDTIELAQEALKIDPKRVEAYVLRGQARRELGYIDRALRDADRALELDAQAAGAHRLRGAIHLERRSFEGAEIALDSALKLDPGDWIASYYRGQVRLARGDEAGALSDFDRVVSKKKRWGIFRVVRARLHARMGNDDAVVEDCTAGLSRGNNSWLFVLRAGVQRRRGNVSAAVRDLGQAAAQLEGTLSYARRMRSMQLLAREMFVELERELELTAQTSSVEEHARQLAAYRAHCRKVAESYPYVRLGLEER